MKTLLITATTIMMLAMAVAQADHATGKPFNWKESVINPDDNELVARAHQVFDRLLLAWDRARIKPELRVIDGKEGLWAAALDSGEIIMTLSAVETSFGDDIQEGMSRLAFVLAHELVHLRSDDLWHAKYFLMSVSGEPSGLTDQFGTMSPKELRKKEMRADAEGLLYMTLVGYDPVTIIGEQDFFTTWVESLFGLSCNDADIRDQMVADACAEAQRRVAHSLERLHQVANQSLLFDLGVQAYVAGRYRVARTYFSSFGRIFPSRAVQTNIGLSYLGEALLYKQQLDALTNAKALQFAYPVIVGAMEPVQSWVQAGLRGVTPHRGPRGGAHASVTALRTSMHEALKGAIDAFEGALKMAPDYRQNYINLASAHLLDNNIPMAKGVLDGMYAREFDRDLGFRLLNAMIAAQEGNYDEAKRAMLDLVDVDDSAIAKDPINREMFLYTATHNLAELLEFMGESRNAEAQWHRLVQRSKENGDTVLFRLSLKELNLVPLMQSDGKSAPGRQPLSLGMRMEKNALRGSRYHRQVWVEGAPIHGYEYEDGRNIVVDGDDRVIALWHENLNKEGEGVSGTADEAALGIIRKHGIPNRRIYTERGVYVAYDDLGLSYQITDQGINGWFYYASTDAAY